MQEQIEAFAQTLSNDELVHFTLKKSDFIEHEIESDGVMFDVIRYKEDNQIIHYWCIRDFAEQILQGEDQSSPEKLKDAHHQWSDHIKQIAKKNISPFIPAAGYLSFAQFSPHRYLNNYLLRLSTEQARIISPPPRFLQTS